MPYNEQPTENLSTACSCKGIPEATVFEHLGPFLAVFCYYIKTLVFFVAVRPFCARWACLYIISGAGVVSGTLHPAV